MIIRILSALMLLFNGTGAFYGSINLIADPSAKDWECHCLIKPPSI